MQLIKRVHSHMNGKAIAILSLVFLAGCAGTGLRSSGERDFMEIPNPAFTMSPNAPETIWVPRDYVEKGVPRGGELAKQGYEAVKGSIAPTARAAAPSPAPQTGNTMNTGNAWNTGNAGNTGITGTGGKPAAILPTFGLVVAMDSEKIYFNIGRETGIAPGQKLKVYRGGTVIEGLGLAPGKYIATVEVQGFVGTRGGYGTVTQGGPVQPNDIIGAE